MTADPFIAVIWFFVLALAACAMVYLAIDRGDRPLQRRLQEMAAAFRISEGNYNEPVGSGGVAETLLEWAQRRLPAPNTEKPAVEKLVQTIQYAGFYSPAAPKLFQAVRLLVTALGGLLGYLGARFVGGSAIILCTAGAAIGYLVPLYYVRWLARTRQSNIRREMADVIDLLVVCVECGLGLLAAIRIVGREAGHQGRIMGEQLSTLSAELAAGASLADGFRAIAQRTGVDDIRTLSAILVQSEKLGTEMGQALRATAEQLRVKRSMRAEEMAQKLPVKMIFPMVFFLLPAILMVLVGPVMIQIFRSFNFR